MVSLNTWTVSPPTATPNPVASPVPLDLSTAIGAAASYASSAQSYAALAQAAAAAATAITNLGWSAIRFTPTTLAGYDITDAAPLSHVGAGGSAHALATDSIAGFMSGADKTKMDGLAAIASSGSASDLTAGTIGAGLLPLASAGAIGAIKIGYNLTIAAGVLSLSLSNVLAALGYTPLNPASSLSDVASAATARTNLGLGSLATLSSIATANFAAGVFDTDATLSANSATRVPAQSAVKSYIDNAVTGLTWKAAVACATSANITLSGEQAIDGVTTSASRVLVKAQTAASNNGIYLTGAGAWTRVSDMSIAAEFPGATVFVEAGSTYANTQWTCTNASPPTVGTTSIGFSQIAGAGVYSAAGGLTLSGNQFQVTAGGITSAMLGAGVALANLGSSPILTLTSSTGLPVGTGIAGLGSGVASALATGVSGTGPLVLANSPSIAGSVTVSSSGQSALNLTDTTQGTDAKTFRAVASGSSLFLQTMNDAGTAASTIFSVYRSGYAITAITFPSSNVNFVNTPQINGKSIWNEMTPNVVRDYGADSSGAASSTTALSNAYTAMTAGQVIAIPVGSYKLTAGITGTKDVTWLIDGAAVLQNPISGTNYNWSDVLPGTVIQTSKHQLVNGDDLILAGSTYLRGNGIFSSTEVDAVRYYFYDDITTSSRVNGFAWRHFTQAGVTGIRQAVLGYIFLSGTPGTTAGGGDFVGLQGYCGTQSANGAGSNALFASNLYLDVRAGGTGYINATGLEIDSVLNGSTSYLSGIQICHGGTGQGSTYDIAVAISSLSGTSWLPWKTGIRMGNMNGQASLGSSSTAMQVVESSILNGIDFSTTSVTSCYLVGTNLALQNGVAQFTGVNQLVYVGNRSTTNTPQIDFFSGNLGAAALIAASGGTGATDGNLLLNAGTIAVTGQLRFATDNTWAFGSASYRATQLFAATATVGTSDATLKKVRGSFSDAELDAVGAVDTAVFQYLDAIAVKGGNARWHYGVVAQQLEASYRKHGLDPAQHALWCRDELVEDIEETYTVDEPATETVTITVSETALVDGKYVLRDVQSTITREIMDAYPLHDADGNPIVIPARAAKSASVDPATGRHIAPIAASDGGPAWHYERRMVPTVKTHTVQKPKLNADGSPMVRYSLRYEHLLVAWHAWTRRELDRLKDVLTRIQTSESKGAV